MDRGDSLHVAHTRERRVREVTGDVDVTVVECGEKVVGAAVGRERDLVERRSPGAVDGRERDRVLGALDGVPRPERDRAVGIDVGAALEHVLRDDVQQQCRQRATRD